MSVCAGDDEATRKGQVLNLLAEQALQYLDFKTSYIHCQDLMAAGRNLRCRRKTVQHHRAGWRRVTKVHWGLQRADVTLTLTSVLFFSFDSAITFRETETLFEKWLEFFSSYDKLQGQCHKLLKCLPAPQLAVVVHRELSCSIMTLVDRSDRVNQLPEAPRPVFFFFICVVNVNVPCWSP